MSSTGVRRFTHQDPLKEKLTREINKRCEEKLRFALL